MTAKEARIKAVWGSIPDIIRSKIQSMVEWGLLDTYLYKSVAPAAFKNIDATIAKLQLLGYTVECKIVDIEDNSNTCGIITDTKLTIKW